MADDVVEVCFTKKSGGGFFKISSQLSTTHLGWAACRWSDEESSTKQLPSFFIKKGFLVRTVRTGPE
jgi:hypothetical protein